MEQRNLIIAIVASIAILLAFQFLYEIPRLQRQQAEIAAQQAAQPAPAAVSPATDPAAPPAPEAAAPAAAAPLSRAEAIAAAPRVAIASARLTGSIALKGGRLDDLILNDYRITAEPRSPKITLLSPAGAPESYYADFGWVAAEPGVALPDGDTLWQAEGEQLTPSQPLTLTWDNGGGLKFTRSYALDDNFMFTVRQQVENSSDGAVTLYPYGFVQRHGTPPTAGFFILHEGLIGVLNGTLEEVNYDDLQEDGTLAYDSTGGWLGITDKYWLVALVPGQQDQVRARFTHTLRDQTDIYQSDFRGAALTLAPGDSVSTESRLFAGAKEVRLLDRYRDALNIPLFDRAVDFGWFYFLTKPIFYVLDYINSAIGNFGLAILVLTIIIKGLFYPLANKSYRAMSRMKLLGPELTKLRERFKDDKQRINQEMMALYKREKVNPAAGCLPIIIQIPVFFALYKVLFVTIEMRHAPFFGWIRDLSAPDPTSIFNLFGLLPWDIPNLGPLQILSIGVWPLIMGVTMWLQQKLNPAPPDPIQARIFMLLPIVFTFMLAAFPAGLVIYWAWNNVLSIAQQRAIMWRMGVKP